MAHECRQVDQSGQAISTAKRGANSALSVLAGFALVHNAFSAAPSNTASSPPRDCFGGLRRALEAGGYTGGLDCRTVSVTITALGAARVGVQEFRIYDLRYRTIPQHGEPPHGGERLLVFDAHGIYLGQYALDTPPFHTLTVRGADVYLDVPKDHGNVVVFTSSGPPRVAYLDQDLKHFAR